MGDTYRIVNVKIPHKSFSHANGLYALLEEKDGIAKLCRLKKNGNLEKYDDGRFMIGGTSIKNISPTPLTWTVEDDNLCLAD